MCDSLYAYVFVENQVKFQSDVQQPGVSEKHSGYLSSTSSSSAYCSFVNVPIAVRSILELGSLTQIDRFGLVNFVR